MVSRNSTTLYWELNGWVALRQGSWRAVKPNKKHDLGA